VFVSAISFLLLLILFDKNLSIKKGRVKYKFGISIYKYRYGFIDKISLIFRASAAVGLRISENRGGIYMAAIYNLI
jgi:hypothetical protein